MVIWYIFPRFGKLYQEKSGNPAQFQVSNWKSFCDSFFSQMNLQVLKILTRTVPQKSFLFPKRMAVVQSV
jgi:hypothetical protein